MTKIKIIKDSHITGLKSNKKYVPSKNIKSIRSHIQQAWSGGTNLSLRLRDGKIKCKNVTERELASVAKNITAILNRFFDLFKDSSVSINANHARQRQDQDCNAMLDLFNSFLPTYNPEAVYAAFVAVDQFIETSKTLDALDLQSVYKEIKFDSGCLAGFTGHLELAMENYSLHKAVVNRFLLDNVNSLVSDASYELHVHPTVNQFFYNERSSDIAARELPIISCSKEIELMLSEKILRLSLDDAINELTKIVDSGLTSKIFESEALKRKVLQIQEQTKGQEESDQAMAIESNSEYIELLLKFLSASGMRLQNEQDPIYCKLSCPTTLFNLQDGASRLTKEEIRQRISNQFAESECIEVSPLDSSDNKLLYAALSDAYKNESLQACKAKMLAELMKCTEMLNIPKHEAMHNTLIKISEAPVVSEYQIRLMLDLVYAKLDDIEEAVMKHFKHRVSNKKALAFIGQRLSKQISAERSKRIKRKIASRPTGNSMEKLKTLICRGNINRELDDAINNFRTNIILSNISQGLRNDNRSREVKFVMGELLASFFFLSKEKKYAMLEYLGGKEITMHPKRFIEKAVEYGDIDMVQYALDFYDIPLFSIDLERVSFERIPVAFNRNLRDVTIKAFQEKKSGANYLLYITGAFFTMLAEQGYQAFKECKDKLGDQVDLKIYKTTNDDNLTLAAYILTKKPQDFPDFWRGLDPEERKVCSRMRVGNMLFAEMVNLHTPDFYVEFRGEEIKRVIKAFGEYHRVNIGTGIQLLTYIIIHSSKDFDLFWSVSTSKERIKALESNHIKDNDSICTLIVRHLPNYFKEIWSNISPEMRSKCIQHGSQELPIQRGVDLDRSTLAIEVIRSSSKNFKYFWNTLTSNDKSVVLQQTDISGSSILLELVKSKDSIDSNFQTIWLDNEVASEVKEKTLKTVVLNNYGTMRTVKGKSRDFYEKVIEQLCANKGTDTAISYAELVASNVALLGAEQLENIRSDIGDFIEMQRQKENEDLREDGARDGAIGGRM